MPDDATTLEDRIKVLEQARDQLSKEWLEVEREKSLLAAAIENLAIGFLGFDDYKNIVIKNQAADKILGESRTDSWKVEEIQEKLGTGYDLVGNIDKCFQQRMIIDPKVVAYGEKKIKIFISPVVILKKSITVPMVVALLEDVTQAA